MAFSEESLIVGLDKVGNHGMARGVESNNWAITASNHSLTGSTRTSWFGRTTEVVESYLGMLRMASNPRMSRGTKTAILNYRGALYLPVLWLKAQIASR